jgi:hypothetical protein
MEILCGISYSDEVGASCGVGNLPFIDRHHEIFADSTPDLKAYAGRMSGE